MFKEAWGGFKATVGDRVLPEYHFIHIVFLFFSVSFSQSLVFCSRLLLEAFQHILDIVGVGQAEVRTRLQNKRGGWLRAAPLPPPTVHLRTDDVT